MVDYSDREGGPPEAHRRRGGGALLPLGLDVPVCGGVPGHLFLLGVFVYDNQSHSYSYTLEFCNYGTIDAMAA
jgi:hypothetical protein